MTEEQITQRILEIQNRVFKDIDQSKSGNFSFGLELVGSNGINVQQQGKKATISVDAGAIQGGGELGKPGDKGDPGSKITGITVTGNLSFTFTFDDGTEITTDPLLSGDGLMYFDGTNIATIPSAGDLAVLGSSGGGQPYWIATEACN